MELTREISIYGWISVCCFNIKCLAGLMDARVLAPAPTRFILELYLFIYFNWGNGNYIHPYFMTYHFKNKDLSLFFQKSNRLNPHPTYHFVILFFLGLFNSQIYDQLSTFTVHSLSLLPPLPLSPINTRPHHSPTQNFSNSKVNKSIINPIKYNINWFTSLT